ncbi:MAG: hydroxymethylglutaryl-CoA lyase [Bdellovibrionales bacterium]|nr:hydroxymethylglutaryl-CoA lyase [Bdellovibrionales bacterium]
MSRQKLQIVEVGLRDGLQNESVSLSVNQKVDLGKKLLLAGVRRLEAGAFVRSDRIPQMDGSDKVYQNLNKFSKSTADLSVLVPNEIGMNKAIDNKVKEVAVFAGCTESFSIRNINCSIEESFHRFEKVFSLAKKNKMKVRGYLSMCFGCPFEGEVKESVVVKLAKRLYEMGAYEISIGDTIGVAHAGQVISLMTKLQKEIPVGKIAGHFHDTRGQALANILAAYQLGIRVFDSSIGGLGGCPYAPAATGNVATEDVLYMFQQMKVQTGIDLKKILEIHPWLQKQMGKSLPSKLGSVGLLKPKPFLNDR